MVSQWAPLALLIVVAALALNWFGDSLDGTLARVRNRLRPRYGFYVDHVIDVAGTLFLLGGLAASGHMTPLIALGVLVAYLMVCAESYLAAHTIGVFRMSHLGIGPTELRILLAAGTLFLLFKTTVSLGGLGRFLLFDVGGVCAIAALAVTFGVSAVRNTITLYREETIRQMHVQRMTFQRWLAFNFVGAGGIAVQLALLAVLTASGMHYLLATSIAVEGAVLNNFAWHERWTWADRAGSSAKRLLRFNLSVGLISIAQNLVFMKILVDGFGLPYLAANLVSITLCSLLNFFVSDRLVFR